MKVSIIIAAYNAEKYICDTLDSVVNQSLKDLEVIIINDGSTDKTLLHIQRYCKNYPYIKSVTQNNSGPAVARNLGIRMAEGDFVFFLDADDLLTPDALSQMVTRAEEQNADIVIGKYNIFNEHTCYPVTNLDNLVKLDAINKYDSRILWTFPLWNKLFRRSMLEKHAISFPALSYSEDGVFTMRCVFHADKITGLDEIVLHYRRDYTAGATSITANVKPWKIEHFTKAHQLIRQDARHAINIDFPTNADENPKVKEWLHAFEIKEIQTIINQFYAHYWHMDPECRNLVASLLESRLTDSSYAAQAELMDRNPYLHLSSMDFWGNTILDHAAITAILPVASEDTESYHNTLLSILGSNIVSYMIFVPASMKRNLTSWNIDSENIYYIEETDSSFLEEALQQVKTEYTLIASEDYLYSFSAFSKLLPAMQEGSFDYISEVIFHMNDKRHEPLQPSLAVYQLHQSAISDGSWDVFDSLLANKLFRSSYLKDLLDSYQRQYGDACMKLEDWILSHLCEGYHAYFDHGIISYCGTEEDFVNYIQASSEQCNKELLTEIQADYILNRFAMKDKADLDYAAKLEKRSQFKSKIKRIIGK